MAPLRTIAAIAAIPILTLACLGVLASYMLPPDLDKHYQLEVKNNAVPGAGLNQNPHDNNTSNIVNHLHDQLEGKSTQRISGQAPNQNSTNPALWDELGLAYMDVGRDPHASNECLDRLAREATWENPRFAFVSFPW
jgi:hypothetical protein